MAIYRNKTGQYIQFACWSTYYFRTTYGYNTLSINNNYPNQSWWNFFTGTQHKQNEWHNYICEWDTAAISTYLDGVHLNTIWKYYKKQTVAYYDGTFWNIVTAKIGSGCTLSPGTWYITEGFPFNNESNSKLIFSSAITKNSKVLTTDGELGEMEIDYIKVFQRHPEADGHSEICASSTYPAVGNILGPEMLCENATYTISPSAASGTWAYSNIYLNKLSETSSSVELEKTYAYPYDHGFITYKYGNGVEGCPIKSISKLLKCPLSYATMIYAINTFDENGKFRIHLLADAYDKLDVDAAVNPIINWTIRYNANADTFNPQTSQTYNIEGKYAIGQISNLAKSSKFYYEWDVTVKYGNDSMVLHGLRNSKSTYLRQSNDTNLVFLDANLPNIEYFDQSILNAVEDINFTPEEANDTLFVKDKIDRIKTQSLEPFIDFRNNQSMSATTIVNTPRSQSLLFPNPSKRSIKIKLSSRFNPLSEVQYEILDIYGKIQSKGILNKSIDVSSLNTGVYLLRLLQESTIPETLTFTKDE